MEFDPDYINLIARKIAWAHWMELNPRNVSKDELELWKGLGPSHREAYRAAARAVAGM